MVPGLGGCCGRGGPQHWVGVAGGWQVPREVPLTLPVRLLQPFGHQDGEWPPGGGNRAEVGAPARWGTAPVSPGGAGHCCREAGGVASCAHPPRDPVGTRGRFVRELAATAAGTAPPSPRRWLCARHPQPPDTPTHVWAAAPCAPLPRGSPLPPRLPHVPHASILPLCPPSVCPNAGRAPVPCQSHADPLAPCQPHANPLVPCQSHSSHVIPCQPMPTH